MTWPLAPVPKATALSPHIRKLLIATNRSKSCCPSVHRGVRNHGAFKGARRIHETFEGLKGIAVRTDFFQVLEGDGRGGYTFLLLIHDFRSPITPTLSFSGTQKRAKSTKEIVL